MTRIRRHVSIERQVDTGRLPDEFTAGAVSIELLHADGRLAKIAEQLKVYRQGGFDGIDIVLFFLVLLSLESPIAIKEVDERLRPHRKRLAGMASRKTLPSSASVSRFLSKVEEDDCEEFGYQLLLDHSKAAQVLRHGSVLHRDALGESWHVFDLDPTVTVLRQRGLPEGEDLPPPRRRAREARSGYRGRKRGEVQLSRATLQHAGSGLWLGLWTGPGNGRWREHSQKALQTVRRIVTECALPMSRTVVRVDGAGGNTPFISGCVQAGLHYVTRRGRYELLAESAVWEHLAASRWVAVRDSGSGPRREATELGEYELEAGSPTAQSDGTTTVFPLRSRLIVSRFRAESSQGDGYFHDGWQYELFATDLACEAWPSWEVVTLYFGRASEENRFHQEDRELDLDRLFSYHLAGQHLANLLGLFVWNLRLCRGFELSDTRFEPPGQVPMAATWESAAVNDASTETAEISELVEMSPMLPPTEVAEQTVEGAYSGAPDEVPVSTASSNAEVPVDTCAGEALSSALAQQNWPKLLMPWPGWTFEAPCSSIRCVNNELLTLRSVRQLPAGTTGQLRFLAPFRACGSCPAKAGCTHSNSPDYRKELCLTVPGSEAREIERQLRALRAAQHPVPAGQPSAPATKPPLLPRPRRTPKTLIERWTPAKSTTSGPRTPTAAHLVPAPLRRKFKVLCRDVDVYVDVQLPPPEEQHPEHFARTDQERQQRRHTWTQRRRRNELPPGATVRIRFAVRGDGARLLAHTPHRIDIVS